PAEDPLATANSQASTDPLAAILPAADPSVAQTDLPAPQSPAASAALEPKIDLTSAGQDSNPMPAGVFGTPVASNIASPDVAPSGGPVVVAAEDHLRSGGKSRKRKKPVLGMLMFGTFAVGMLALIGTLIYFLVFGPGQVAITNSGGQLTISTEPDEGDDMPVVGPPRDVTEGRAKPQPLDPVMGNLGGGMPPPSGPSELANQLESGTKPSTLPMDESTQTEAAEPMTSMTEEMNSPEMTPSAPTVVEAPDDPPMVTEPEDPPLTDEMIAEVDKKLIELSALIKSADWKQMKPVAETITEMKMTEEQQGHAEALYELADLATYYRGGIEKAVAGLEIGNDFAVTDDFRVIVVEKGDDLLVVRYNQKNRSWNFDELPFSMAHKLATFEVPASPTGEAAKAVYQAVAPKSSDEYRQESITILRNISGEVEGADSDRLADTIEALFKEGA
ncbi:MAG: hypothetical protein ACR2NZ_22395, partial [Rubripirellula sp.]